MHKYTYMAHKDVLINKLNIKDFDVLRQVEAGCSFYRAHLLQNNPIDGDFDLEHLKAIHAYLFQDIYPFAGQIRLNNISKRGVLFADVDNIESDMAKWYKNLEDDNFLRDISDRDSFVIRFSKCFSELNRIHPFREGNGRATRLFMGQLCDSTGRFTMDDIDVDKEVWNDACEKALNNDISDLYQIFKAHIHRTSDIRNLQVGHDVKHDDINQFDELRNSRYNGDECCEPDILIDEKNDLDDLQVT